jgi:chromate transporter
MIFARLTIVFGILSLLGFGGGRAIIPQIYADAVLRYHWVSAAEFARFFAISKLAPGPTTLVGALIGFAVAGVLGSLVATIALYAPSSFLCYLLGRLWQRFHGALWRDALTRSVAPIVVGLIWAGSVAIANGALNVPLTYLIAAGVAAILLFTRINPTIAIIAAGLAGGVLLR